MKQRLLVAAGLGFIAALAACSALIGTRDLTLEPGDAGPSGPDGTVPGADGATGSTGPLSDGANPGSDGAQPSDDAGEDSAPPATCSTADLQTDALNCGTCGHSCLGGQCSGGICQAFTLVAGQFGAGGIVVDATGIYWTTTSTPQVLRANTDGTGMVVLAANANWLPLNVAVDGTHAYWVDDQEGTGSILRCGKTACDAGPTQITPATLDVPNVLATDGLNVYWTEYEGDAVGRVKVDGGGFGYIATNLDYGDTVTVDDAGIFFGTYDTVGRLPKGTSSTTDPAGDAGYQFATVASATYVFGVSADSTNVYWAVNNDPGNVQFAPKGGSGATPQNLSSSEHNPVVTVVDATNVYWTAQGTDSTPSGDYSTYLNGYVASCPKAGCPAAGPTMLATGLHSPYGIAVDDTAIYFTIMGNESDSNPVSIEGSVMKIAK